MGLNKTELRGAMNQEAKKRKRNMDPAAFKTSFRSRDRGISESSDESDSTSSDNGNSKKP